MKNVFSDVFLRYVMLSLLSSASHFAVSGQLLPEILMMSESPGQKSEFAPSLSRLGGLEVLHQYLVAIPVTHLSSKMRAFSTRSII